MNRGEAELRTLAKQHKHKKKQKKKRKIFKKLGEPKFSYVSIKEI